MKAAVWPYFLFKLAQIRPPPPHFDNILTKNINVRVLYTIELLRFVISNSI
nr:MAG TPA: hypothetical protein [Caudoviricetes sp.]DAY29568.1 MAG TPA: hypothetical protein [Caudoviricetes sp.]